MLLPLNLNGNKLTNLSPDTNDKNSVSTVTYVQDMDTRLTAQISILLQNVNNHVYRETFEHFYDSRETFLFIVIGQVSGVVVNKIKPNLFLETDRYIKDYNKNFGFKLSTKGYISTDITTKNSNNFHFIYSWWYKNVHSIVE